MNKTESREKIIKNIIDYVENELNQGHIVTKPIINYLKSVNKDESISDLITRAEISFSKVSKYYTDDVIV